MSKQLRLDVAQLTDVGRKRPHNEDNMAYVIPKDPQVMARKGALFIVADGMGGHAAGEVASEIAVDTVSKVYYQDDTDDIAISLVHAIKRANTLIHQRAAENMMRSGMGTTCVAAVLRGGIAYIANVGDSRAYLVRKGMVKQVSQDHSWVEEQVRAGLLTRDQARSHAQRNVITRCLGTQAEVEIDVFAEHLEECDSMVLCSDGLSGLIADEELCAIVDQYVPQESVYHLVERANENGGSDNITAVVIRVQEVGCNPPGVSMPHPVGVGSCEKDEDTAVIGQFRGSPLVVGNLPPHAADGRVTSAPLSLISGPLISPGSMPSPQPAPPASRSRRNRLFYPTLALFVVLVVALVGGGSYYFLQLYLWQADINTSLTTAKTLIRQADTEAESNPTAALQKLKTAQENLLKVQNQGSLNADERKQFDTLLESDFTTTVKRAITSYNQQSLILALPCSTTKSSPITTGNTGTQANSIVTVRNGQNKILYALGADSKLYQLNEQQSLGNQLDLPGEAQPLMIVGAGSRLLVLAKNLTNNFVLYVILPDEKEKITSTTIDAKWTKNGATPSLITASGQDVYVALTPPGGTGSAVLLGYTFDGDTFRGNPRDTTISLSNKLISLAAFPQNQLFLLLEDGSVQSLLFNGQNQAAVSVVLAAQPPLAPPLGVRAQDFKADTPVPTPLIQSVDNLPLLSVPGATALVVRVVDKVQHLYLMDEENHRVLDLLVAPTPANASTTTPTPTKTVSGGGAGAQVTLKVFQQYTSTSLFSGMKSIAVDLATPDLYLLAQGAQGSTTSNLISINTQTPETSCSSA